MELYNVILSKNKTVLCYKKHCIISYDNIFTLIIDIYFYETFSNANLF